MVLDYIPALKMYVSKTPAPPVFDLRAWVQFSPTLPRVLCSIVDVDGALVQVQPVGREINFFATRAHVHSVHRASLTTGEVVQFYGEPKPC